MYQGSYIKTNMFWDNVSSEMYRLRCIVWEGKRYTISYYPSRCIPSFSAYLDSHLKFCVAAPSCFSLDVFGRKDERAVTSDPSVITLVTREKFRPNLSKICKDLYSSVYYFMRSSTCEERLHAMFWSCASVWCGVPDRIVDRRHWQKTRHIQHNQGWRYSRK